MVYAQVSELPGKPKLVYLQIGCMTLLTLPYGEQLFVLYISREIRYDALRRDYFSVLTIVFIGFFDYTSR